MSANAACMVHRLVYAQVEGERCFGKISAPLEKQSKGQENSLGAEGANYCFPHEQDQGPPTDSRSQQELQNASSNRSQTQGVILEQSTQVWWVLANPGKHEGPEP